MLVLKGKGVGGGVTIGTLAVFKRQETVGERHSITDIEGEVARFQAARGKAIEQLAQLY